MNSFSTVLRLLSLRILLITGLLIPLVIAIFWIESFTIQAGFVFVVYISLFGSFTVVYTKLESYLDENRLRIKNSKRRVFQVFGTILVSGSMFSLIAYIMYSIQYSAFSSIDTVLSFILSGVLALGGYITFQILEFSEEYDTSRQSV
jgi:hypothetical protein